MASRSAVKCTNSLVNLITAKAPSVLRLAIVARSPAKTLRKSLSTRGPSLAAASKMETIKVGITRWRPSFGADN